MSSFLDKKTPDNRLKASLLALLAVSCFGLPQSAVALDSDGDSISDILDLDDDNDGILDTAEGCEIPGILPQVAGERNSGDDYRGNINSNNAANVGQTNGWHPSNAGQRRGVYFEDASGDTGNALTGTVSATDGANNISVNYVITKEAEQTGYAYTRYSRSNNGKIMLVGMGLETATAANPDVLSYKIALSGVTSGYQSRVTLKQSTDYLQRFNSEASSWVFTWDGGGQATWHDDATPNSTNNTTGSTRMYNAGFPADPNYPLFNINEREIPGLSTSGQFSSGGTLQTYSTTNYATRWRIVFPAGATNIKVIKTTLAGGLVDAITDNPADGTDALWPKYGKTNSLLNGAGTWYNGESFVEVLTYQIDFVRDTDNDDIPDCLDLDSDNDGCSDAQEGGANLTTFVTASGTLTDGNGDVVTQNLGNNVNTTSTSPSYGVPSVAGTGQTVGGSQTAAQMTITTPLVSDQSVTVGDNVTFDVTSTAYQTTMFNSGTPDYSASTAATGIAYQWYKSTDNGNTWTAVAGSTGTAEDLAFPSVAYSDAGQYKREMTCDQNSCAVETAVVTLTINRPPVATPDTQLVSENTPANGTLLDNDTDADGDRLTVTHITIPGVNGGAPIAVPANGSVTQSISGVGTITVHSDGTYTFVPQANYTGTIPVIGYTVSDGNGGTASSTLTLTMSPTNDAPIADNANVNTTAGTAVSVPLNGVDAEDPSSALTYTIASVPPASQATLTYTDSNGVVQTLTAGTTLTAAEAASVQVTPVSGYTGPIDNLTYTVTDTEGAVSPTATVTFNGTDVNDPPIADNDTVTAIENTPIGIPLNGADVDGTVTTYTITQIPQASEGTLTYTDANGVTQTVSVGTTLTPAEVATLTFTPAPNYTGTVTPVQFTVTDDDNAVSNTATVTISNIVSANTAPTANNANVTTTAGTASPVPLNGVDAEDPSSALTYTIASVPPASQATLTYDHDGDPTTPPIALTAGTTLTTTQAASVQITPASGYTGPIENLTYTVTDTKGAVSPVATVTFNGTDVNDPPIAHHGAITPVEDTPINVPLNGRDVDVNGTVTGVMITAAMPSNQGTLMYDDDNDPNTPAIPVPLNTELTPAQAATVQFVPAPNYSGPVTDVVFTVKDDDNLWSNPAVVTIANIVDVNDPPTADNNNVTPNGNNPVSVPLNGSDVDGTISSVTVTQVPPTSQGTVTYTDSNGVTQTLTPNTTLTPSEAATVRFTPNPNHSGTVMPIIFTVTDNNGAVSQPAMIRFAPSAMPVTVFSLWSGLLMMWLLTAQALLFMRRRKR